MRTVAVITDVVDPEFFYPLWHGYYSKLFGSENLFAVTYRDSKPLPTQLTLGGTIKIPLPYNDKIRSKFISKLNTAMLGLYEVVIRVDVDEFLVPDPRQFSSLSDYVERLKSPYVTAFGLDVIEGRDEQPLNLSEPILVSQRRFAYPNASLNKTCLTTIPTRWLDGFHFCTLYPKFDDLFLIHMKRADKNQQISWAENMVRAAPGNEFVGKYYSTEVTAIGSYWNNVLSRPVFKGWEGMPRDVYQKKLLNSYRPVLVDGEIIYSGAHYHDDILVELPAEFRDIL